MILCRHVGTLMNLKSKLIIDYDSIAGWHYCASEVIASIHIVEWANELYHSNDESVSTNYFSDLSVSYRTKSYETGLQCSNLFGTREYRRHYTTSYTDVVVLNHLRPREFLAKLLFNI